MTKPGGPTLGDNTQRHIDTILDLVPPTAAMIADQQWSLNVFQQESLITSDHPVVLLPRKGHPPHEGLGLATAAGLVVPLTRQLAIVTNASPDLPDTRVSGGLRLAVLINAGVAANARASVFHHPEDVGILTDIRLHEPRHVEIDDGGDHLIREAGRAGALLAA